MEELISKKELLKETGISYGQLYRWKRKEIIPENWFIKKSVPSGQETFFPREKILERIDVILNMKEEVSLDELAKMFSSKIESGKIDIEKLIKKRIFSEESIELYKQMFKRAHIDTINQIMGIKLVNDYVIPGEITLEEGKLLIHYLNINLEELSTDNSRVYLFRNKGLPFVLGTRDYKTLICDDSYKCILELHVEEELSNIKLELMD